MKISLLGICIIVLLVLVVVVGWIVWNMRFELFPSKSKAEQILERIPSGSEVRELGTFSTEKVRVDVTEVTKEGELRLVFDGAQAHDTGVVEFYTHVDGDTMTVTYAKDQAASDRDNRMGGTLILEGSVEVPPEINHVYLEDNMKERVQVWQRVTDR